MILAIDYKEGLLDDYSIERELLGDLKVIALEGDWENDPSILSNLAQAVVILTGFLKIDAAFLEKTPNLKFISINATGYDNLDLESLQRRGIGAAVIGEYCTEEVSESTLAMILALKHQHILYRNQMEENQRFDYKEVAPELALSQMTAGIIGYGRIGHQTAKIMRPLVKRILVHDIQYKSDEEFTSVEQASCERIQQEADIIINHMNLTEDNVHYFNQAFFDQLQKPIYFINMSRGSHVDETALIQALDCGQVAFAGLDVLAEENPDLNDHPLLFRSNVLITPHAAFYSKESLEKLHRISAENILHFQSGALHKINKLLVGGPYEA